MNPCTGVCKFTQGSCQGCKRTIPEIQHWWDMPAEVREQILEELPNR